MTIQTAQTKGGPYEGDDAATTFDCDFKMFATSDVKVVFTNTSGIESTLTEGVDYSVALNSDQDTDPGATVTYPLAGDPLASGSPPEKLTLEPNHGFTQKVDLKSGGGYNPQSNEDALDRNTILSTIVKVLTERALLFPTSDTAGLTYTLPTETLRASKAVIFDASGNLTVSTDDYNDQATAAAASAAAAAASATAAAQSASAIAFPWEFDSGSTSMADPGLGKFRLNNASIASVTAMAVSKGTASSGNPDVSDYVAQWDDSTSNVDGFLRILEEGTPANYGAFQVGAVTDNGDWLQVTLTYVDDGAALFTSGNNCRFAFTRTGDKGDTGATGATGPAPTYQQDIFNGGTDTFVLTQAPAASTDIRVTVFSVPQPNSVISTYTVGTKTVVLTDSVAAGTDVVMFDYFY